MRSKAVTIRAMEKIEKTNKSWLGMIFYVCYCLIYTLSFVFISLLYEHEPTLDPFPMLFIRYAVAIVIMTLFMNIGIKK